MLRSIVVSLVIGVGVQVPAYAQDAATVKNGKAVYERHCAYCHRRPAVEGELLVAPMALKLKYKGTLSPYIDERSDLGNLDVLRGFVRTGVAGMLPIRKTEVSEAELRAIAAYIATNAKATAR